METEMAEIYRGYEIVKASDGMYEWKREDGAWVGGYKTEDEAMSAVDAHRRDLRAKLNQSM
jgi:uncharacterized protein YegP (UPF0339 family)